MESKKKGKSKRIDVLLYEKKKDKRGKKKRLK